MITPVRPEDLPPSPPPPVPPGASGRAVVALVLGLLGLMPCCVFLAGVPAIIVGQLELAAIRAGEAPAAGAGMARLGCWLGAIGSALGVLILLGWFFLAGLGGLLRWLT